MSLCLLFVAGYLYVYIIDQARGQGGWILAEFSFGVFMDRDEVEVDENVKRERGQCPAILTELAWSIKSFSTDDEHDYEYEFSSFSQLYS